MRNLVVLLLLVLVVSCKNKEVDKKEVVSETVAEVATDQSNDIEEGKALIPFYNYEELEAKYLQPKNDTTYVVNFWATWCKPCIKELPAFEKLNADYANKKVKVVLVSLDFPDRVVKQVVPFIEKRNLNSEVVLLDDPDANSWIPKVDENWSGAIPATIITTKDKKTFYERSFTFEELETELKTIL